MQAWADLICGVGVKICICIDTYIYRSIYRSIYPFPLRHPPSFDPRNPQLLSVDRVPKGEEGFTLTSHTQETTPPTCFPPTANLAFTRYFFTPMRLCTIQASVYCPLPPASPALLQWCCTSIALCTTPPDSRVVCYTPLQYWRWQYRVKANCQPVFFCPLQAGALLPL